MNTVDLRNVLARRSSLHINDDLALMECWEQETEILSDDLSETIAFFDTCTDKEFYWLSEVFDNLIEKTQSRELFQAICKRAERVNNREYKVSIATDIEFAKDQFSRNDVTTMV